MTNTVNFPGVETKVKICGVTRLDDVRYACELGAGFIGLNFYPKSPRFVSVELASKLRSEMSGRARAVGVFVNTPAAEVESIAEAVGLDLVQFHGDETPEDLGSMTQRAIKAMPVGEDFSETSLAEWQDCWGLLFDAPAEKLYGGSGQSWSYEKVRAVAGRTFLAGGLTPSNVRAAIRTLPDLYAVDVCSGVEAEPGVKCPEKLQDFFRQVHGH